MYTLRMLGGISLTDDGGGEVDALLRQSKHIALLSYLASPAPGTWHKRDSVIGTFWAEHDQSRGRAAFRSALYTLRGHLPEKAIRSRGDNDLSVDPQIVTTDTAAMSELLQRGEFEKVLALYKGEFLPGIYVADAEGFDQWLEQERRRTKSIACQAAKRLSRERESQNDLPGAIEAARRNYELDPDDEGTARRLIALLDAVGDRAQAFAVYEEFRNHMSEAFGVRPSAETVALLDAIRTRHEPGAVPLAIARRPSQDALSPESSSPAAEPKSRRARNFALIAIAALVSIAGFVYVRVTDSSDAGAASRSLSVAAVPFRNISPDTTLGYRADGMTDEILTALGNVHGLRVVGRNAARRYKGGGIIDERAVSRELGARILLTGTYQQAANRVSISIQLTDSVTHAELWSTMFSGDAFDLPGVTNDIARAIIDTLHARFSRIVERPARGSIVQSTTNQDALESYLLGQAFFKRRGGGIKQSIASFEHAIELDKKFARAHAALARALGFQSFYNGIAPSDVRDRISYAARTALDLDSTLADAHGALAWNEWTSGHWDRAAAEFEKATRLAPDNFDAHFDYGRMLILTGQLGEARRQFEQARRIEMISPILSAWSGYLWFLNGDTTRALREINRAIQLDSTLLPTVNLGALTAVATGHTDVARRLMLIEWPPTVMSNSAYIAAKLGDTIKANSIVAEMKKNSPRPWFTDMQFATTRLAVGDTAGALQAIEEGARVSGPIWVALIVPGDPVFDAVRRSPHFIELIRRAGLDPRSLNVPRASR
jgi:TolB-like protein/DNA-binding SARP family transcriptional activator/Tfp pilus assembly protein PilF